MHFTRGLQSLRFEDVNTPYELLALQLLPGDPCKCMQITEPMSGFLLTCPEPPTLLILYYSNQPNQCTLLIYYYLAHSPYYTQLPPGFIVTSMLLITIFYLPTNPPHRHLHVALKTREYSIQPVYPSTHNPPTSSTLTTTRSTPTLPPPF